MSSNPIGDYISYEIFTQDICLEIVSPPQRCSRWYQGLSLQIDQEILGGKVIAYQIRWWFFVTWYGSIGGHKSTKSLSGKRFN
jgi:hypothetical protein